MYACKTILCDEIVIILSNKHVTQNYTLNKGRYPVTSNKHVYILYDAHWNKSEWTQSDSVTWRKCVIPS